ncbi:MAG: PfkB family carbohydrate kinase [Bacteroidales bacterium]
MGNRIFAVGETVLDIIFKENDVQAARPGGSSFNAAITLGRLGAPVEFISEMGADKVGDMIVDFLEKNQVKARLGRYTDGKTALALAFLDHHSDAEYQFYKDYPHQRLQVEFPEIKSGDLLLFGSFYALNPGIRQRIRVLLQQGFDAGALLLYDPNFRESHLRDREALLPVITENMTYASLVRASDEDMRNVFGVLDADAAWDRVKDHCPVLVYTASSRGVFLRTKAVSLHLEVEKIEPLSTIGAGDNFNAGLAYGMHRKRVTRVDLQNLGAEDWTDLLRTAMAFSKAVCLSYDNYLSRDEAGKLKTMVYHQKRKEQK